MDIFTYITQCRVISLWLQNNRINSSQLSEMSQLVHKTSWLSEHFRGAGNSPYTLLNLKNTPKLTIRKVNQFNLNACKDVQDIKSTGFNISRVIILHLHIWSMLLSKGNLLLHLKYTFYQFSSLGIKSMTLPLPAPCSTV